MKGGREVRQPIFDCNISHQRQNVSHCTAHKRRHVKANFNIFRDMAFTLSVPPPLLLFVQFERAPIHMFPHIALLARIPCSVSAVDSHATTYPSLQATSNFTWQNKLHKVFFFAICRVYLFCCLCRLCGVRHVCSFSDGCVFTVPFCTDWSAFNFYFLEFTSCSGSMTKEVA